MIFFMKMSSNFSVENLYKPSKARLISAIKNMRYEILALPHETVCLFFIDFAWWC